MKAEAFEIAVSEAKRFLLKAKGIKINKGGVTWNYLTSDPKATGALRRASMDLTRALAEMRKP